MRTRCTDSPGSGICIKCVCVQHNPTLSEFTLSFIYWHNWRPYVSKERRQITVQLHCHSTAIKRLSAHGDKNTVEMNLLIGADFSALAPRPKADKILTRADLYVVVSQRIEAHSFITHTLCWFKVCCQMGVERRSGEAGGALWGELSPPAPTPTAEKMESHAEPHWMRRRFLES